VSARAALTALLALTLGGCAFAPAPSPETARAWDAGAARLDSLTSADRVEDALAFARVRVRLVRAGLAPAWRAREADAVARSLTRRAALPPADRAALAAADRALLAAPEALAADSLAAVLDLRRAAWRAHVERLGTDDPSAADAALALAESELALAHPREADSLGHVALAAFRRLGAGHPRVADAEDLLGRVVKNYTGTRRVELASAHYDAALGIRVRTLGPGSLAAAGLLQELGNLYRVGDRPREALTLMQAALDIRRARLGPHDDAVATTLASVAYVHAGLGHWAAAEACVRDALAATPAGITTTAGSRSMRLMLHGQMLRRLGRLAEAERALREVVALRESLWTRTPRDEAASVVSGLTAHRELALAMASDGQGDAALEEVDRGSARALVERLIDTRAGDPWHDLLARVQRVLPGDMALVGWPRVPLSTLQADYPMWAYVVRAHGPVHWVRLDRVSPLDPRGRTVRERYWTELMAAAQWPVRVTDTAPAARMAAAMWRERFAPLEPFLGGATRLVVCSPDLLAAGPVGALRDARGRWLDQRFSVSYAPSVLLWLRARERAGGAPAARGRGALLVGDPAYPTDEPAPWPRLGGTGREIAAIATHLPGAITLTGLDASAARLRALERSGALARVGIVHLAAHTAIDDRRVMESALVLAPDTPGGRSSRLSAREIVGGWRIGADLVSLAACRSVQGMSSASDGSLGLQSAFLAAGARSLLVALWPVDDRAGAILMEEFYARLADPTRALDRADALREAQAAVREWRAADGTRPFAHPAYWAGFVLVGAPR
jgi:hypothetical protein